MSAQAVRCVRCAYPRAGLPDDAACPECGAPHDAETLRVRGMATRSSCEILLALGVLTTALGFCGFTGLVQGGLYLSALVIALGVILLCGGVSVLRERSRGGGIEWILTPGGIEMSLRGWTLRVPWDRLDGVRRRTTRSGWERLEARSRALFLGRHPVIWLLPAAAAEGLGRWVEESAARRVRRRMERPPAPSSASAPPDAPPRQ